MRVNAPLLGDKTSHVMTQHCWQADPLTNLPSVLYLMSLAMNSKHTKY